MGEEPCSGEREPGLLPADVGRVTDSKMREWASLGVNRGARSSGLLFWKDEPSKRDAATAAEEDEEVAEEEEWWW